jgi:tungstate transport system substrate-binding protein
VRQLLLALGVALFAAACAEPIAPRLRLATTTSVQNSGLLAHLQPPLGAATGLDVVIHAAGSGRALLLLEQREVDAVISHAPDAEKKFLATHPDWSYRKFAFNRFIVVGPRDDPARIAAASNAADAFRRILDAGTPFVSRGDQSGTHEREMALWHAAGAVPEAPRLIVSGRGMAQALRHADQARAYTLTDEPTFWQLSDDLDLQMLFSGDDRLLNTYAVIAHDEIASARAFQDWLLSNDGRGAVASFTVGGRQAYQLWPDGCPNNAATSALCPTTH